MSYKEPIARKVVPADESTDATCKDYRPKNLSYADAGVNIDNGNRLVDLIKPVAASTHGNGKGVIGGLGSFAAFFDIGALNYQDPILVAATDGVGTKLKLAIDMQQINTIGIDLVAMCVNDIIVQGADPLFFLDYLSCGQLNVNKASEIINGIAEGCKLAGCALVGGETAEMPGMYLGGEYDLAGFCVGAVERDAIIDGRNVQPGDVLIGISSSGPHANGYSLIHKIIEHPDNNLDRIFEHGKTLGDVLIEPTKIYVTSIQKLLKTCQVKALAHITGGGLVENLPRAIPDNVQAIIDTQSWSLPAIFKWLQDQGNIKSHEMYRTFNCGVGLIACVAQQDKNRAIKDLQIAGENVWEIGQIKDRKETDKKICFVA